MFTKKKRVGRADVYKEVTDWEAILVVLFWGFIALICLVTCTG